MIRLFDNFFPANVFAGITDRSVNFERPPQTSGLTESQQKFLLKQGVDLLKITHIRQVHGKRVVFDSERRTGIEDADGLATDRPEIPLMIRVADCLPVFVYDLKTKASALIHAGWRGTKEQISLEALKVFKEKFHSDIKDIRVGLGPSIRSCCYEVGQEFQEMFPRETVQRSQMFFFDLSQANKNQLIDAGILKEHIADSATCTCCDQRFFSYRREGKAAGRMLALIKVS